MMMWQPAPAHAAKPQVNSNSKIDLDDDDQPQLREKWFLRGRKSPDNHPAAEHRRNAVQQSLNLPMHLGGGGSSSLSSMLKPLLGELAPSGGCDWSEMGPSPQTSSSWGNVSGRITSLGLDLTNDPTGNTVYLGAAYGGLWESTNGLGSTP
ncbi:MAG TPA: hypothetical protein VK859_15530, partial [bacterium]|nr:hypothetical protein [bacterium]